jgi:predicted transposase YdaD
MTDTDTDRTTDHDSPWKIALDGYFKEFLELLFPHIPSEIDWRQGYTSLDKELQQVTPDANSGRRYADKLVKVHTLEGHETWVLIHVEVQGEPEDAFAQRMYTYQYRLRDRYGVDVVSLAVLADTSPGFRPAAFNYDRWGCALQYRFPMSKLIDFESNWEVLEQSANVFALVVMAQLKAKRVKDGVARKDAKVAIIRLMYERGYSKQQILELFNVIDWMIQLPSSLNEAFLNTIYAIEEDKNMPYINTAERVGLEKGELIGIQKGRVEGRMEGRLETMRETALGLLELKFGQLPDWATQMISQADATKLDTWTKGVLTAESLEALLGKH